MRTGKCIRVPSRLILGRPLLAPTSRLAFSADPAAWGRRYGVSDQFGGGCVYPPLLEEQRFARALVRNEALLNGQPEEYPLIRLTAPKGKSGLHPRTSQWGTALDRRGLHHQVG